MSVGLLFEKVQRTNVLKYEDDEEKQKLKQLIDFIDKNAANLYAMKMIKYSEYKYFIMK